MATLSPEIAPVLTTYDTKDVIWKSGSDLAEAIKSRGYDPKTPRFVRFAYLGVTGMSSLQEALGESDKTLTMAARYCGATVLWHEWGLASTPKDFKKCPEMDSYKAGQLLPGGYALVALVDQIRDPRPLSHREITQVTLGLESYQFAAEFAMDEVIWDDPEYDQFVSGILPGASSRTIILTDIEPSITCNKQPNTYQSSGTGLPFQGRQPLSEQYANNYGYAAG